MRQSGDSTIQVPRAMIFALLFALLFALFPGFAAVVNNIGDPRLQAVRSVDVVRLTAIGWCAGIFFSGLLLVISSKIANRNLGRTRPRPIHAAVLNHLRSKTATQGIRHGPRSC
jgi:hypothetical protein